MNKYVYMMILLIMMLLFLLSGCTGVQSEGNILTAAPSISAEAPSAEPPSIPAEPPSSEPPNTTEPGIEIEEPTDHARTVDIRDGREEDLAEGACWQYTADEDGIYLTIFPDATVYSFKFVAVHVEEAASGLQYLIDEELYSIEELTPDKPFLVKMRFVGLLPTYGIVFEDQNNHERFYTINEKGTGPEESYPYYLKEIE